MREGGVSNRGPRPAAVRGLPALAHLCTSIFWGSSEGSRKTVIARNSHLNANRRAELVNKVIWRVVQSAYSVKSGNWRRLRYFEIQKLSKTRVEILRARDFRYAAREAAGWRGSLK